MRTEKIPETVTRYGLSQLTEAQNYQVHEAAEREHLDIERNPVTVILSATDCRIKEIKVGSEIIFP